MARDTSVIARLEDATITSRSVLLILRIACFCAMSSDRRSSGGLSLNLLLRVSFGNETCSCSSEHRVLCLGT